MADINVLQDTMSDDIIRLILLILAGVTLPAGYIAVCVWMRQQNIWWFAYLAYFVLFGTVGGWAFTFAMSPSGIAATSTVFLISVALVACIASSIVLTFRRGKSRPERIAMICGYSYPGLLAAYFAVGLIFLHASK